MSLETFSCLECGVRLRRSPNLAVGALVQCPKCGVRFAVPPEDASQNPEPAPSPRSDSEERRYSDSPRASFDPEPQEERSPFDRTGTRRADDAPPRSSYGRYDRRDRDEVDEDYPLVRFGDSQSLSNDYEVNGGRWFTLAREHYGAIAPLASAYQFLAAMIGAVAGMVPFAGGIVRLLVDPPLEAGQTLVCLAQLKGKRWAFADFFGGFKFYGQTIVLALLHGLAVGACLLPVMIAGIVAMVMLISARGGAGGGPPPFALALGIFAVALLFSGLLAAYIGIRLGFFALPLVLERGFSATEAMSGSWKLTQGHFLQLFGLCLSLWLIIAAPASLFGGGLMAFFVMGMSATPGNINAPIPFEVALFLSTFASAIPSFFTLPFVKLVTTAAYLDVAGLQRPMDREQAERSSPELEDYRDRY